MAASRSRRASAKQYRWEKGIRRSKKLAQAFGETLESVMNRSGEWRAVDVVNVLRKRNHPCHRMLEWDDAVAAERWREESVRCLARKLEFIVEDSPNGSVPVAMSFGAGKNYMATDRVLMDAELRQRWLEMALREAQHWKRRYSMLRELVTVFEAIDRVAKRSRV